MKIVISAQGKELESPVDPRFGRASYFIFYDTDSSDFEIVDNQQNVMANQGAGVQAAQNVAKLNPDLVISGNYGPKAFQILAAAGIKTALWSDGKVSKAIELALDDQLDIATNANVSGHWK